MCYNSLIKYGGSLDMAYWTDPSVIKFAGDNDPVEVMQNRVREIVLNAIQEGWAGPPFDPFELAEHLGIPITPREDIQDARTIPVGGRGLRIEFNPNKPRGRMRFSVAHEIGHTLFPDCAETVRTRGLTEREDSWQLELLCNLAAAEILMPIGAAVGLEREPVRIDNVLRLQREYDVSTEAICLRMIKLTAEPYTLFAATRTSPALSSVANYRIDYSVPSRATKFSIPQGFEVSSDTVLSQCTAIGFTAKGTARWARDLPKIYVECVGIPPYPGQYFPRIIGILQSGEAAKPSGRHIDYLWGDALKPRGKGHQIIAHIVNDKTPNWGGFGFARAVKKRFPSVQSDFQQWVNSDPENLSLGRIHLSEVAQDLDVVSMIAQHGYGPSRKPRIRYSVLKNCLRRLAEIAVERRASVHMPRIGSGQAGGKWPIIAELIDEALIQRGIDVTVYSLPSSQLLEETQSLLHMGVAVQ
jgi:O-acetyl-ADP-ribose deacetylase (regulator of RNase III)